MHEVSIMEQTLEIALNHAKQQGATQIHWLKRKVGALSGVIPEAFEFAFDVVAKGTMAETAIFEIDSISVRCYCHNCQVEFQPDDYIYECPHCHQYSLDILQGKELELTSLEVS